MTTQKTQPNAITVQKSLKGIKYPATKDDLLKQAKANKADKDVMSILEELKTENFKNPAEVSKAVSK